MSSVFYEENDSYSGKFDKKVWKRILTHAAPYKKQLAGLALSGFFIAIADVLIPWINGSLIDEATRNGLSNALYSYGIAYAIILVGFAFFVWWFIVLAGQTATGVAHDLREAGFERLQALSFSYYDVRPVGWLISRLTSDCSKLSNLIPWFMLDLVWGSLLIAGVAVMMFWLSWKLACVVMLIVPALAGVSVYFQKKLFESSRQVRKINSQITASYTEGVAGVRTTKTLVREERNLEEFQGLSGGMYFHSTRNALQSAVYLPMISTIGSIGVALALWTGGVQIQEGLGGVTIGQLVTFMMYAGLLYMPIQELSRRFADLQGAQAAAERVQDLLDTVPDIRDSEEVKKAIALAESGQPIPSELDVFLQKEPIQSIEFKDVAFAYTENEKILEDFSLSVQAGQTIALVGSTGGGKSTIVNLAARFYEPTEGELLINGVDYRKRPLQWLQSKLGVVLQSPHLFSGTIRENIRYGRLDATDEEIVEAAKCVFAHDFILRQENGYDAEVGEGGNQLSTGEKQLISLARAILSSPEIFIMDEATSSVDTETEKLLQAGVEKVLEGRIAFVIAHRLSTIQAADNILVIDKGRIVEQGTHQQLMKREGRYYELVTKQFVEGVLV